MVSATSYLITFFLGLAEKAANVTDSRLVGF